MRGTVQKKGKRWYAVVYDGLDEEGKQKRRWVPGGDRKVDAERVLEQLIHRKYQGEPAITYKGTLGEYLTERWQPVQKSRVRQSTFDNYRRNIDLHVLPALGQRQLGKLNPDDLDLFYADLLAGGRKKQGGTSKGLAPKTVRNIHVMLNKALSDATRKGLVARNVAELADPPSVSAQRRDDIKAWDADQLCTFLDSIEEHRLFPAYYLSANTGMRRGEILGLRWGDLDLERGLVSVQQALISVAYQVQISDVKTSNGRRTIEIEEDVVDVLDEWRELRLGENGGRKLAQTDLVFTKPDGSWIHPDSFSQTFDRAVAKLDIPEISLHDLRHTHATILLRDGTTVKVVSERLGHANPAFTMSVYQHVLPGMQAEAAAAFSRLLKTARSKRKKQSES
jgi:integrase